MREWLLSAREQRTQREIAEIVGIKSQYYCMIEKGKRTPSVHLAKQIASELNVDWTMFYN